MIYIITLSSTACGIYGNSCLKNVDPDEKFTDLDSE